ncbi:very-long-chain 3-oxoacyl-CoA reductase-B-like [Oncorhynchus masou masou]|uniref:very-long-chain 3-oxoacyl-CoA reductase-B-like n=1 Tax=Oncorhynchus masou masou TaxID=90313 RepID=UPI00318406F4
MDTVSDSMLVRGLVFIDGFTVLYYMLKWPWICWCGFRVYVLSKVWQTDLKAYGQWAVVTGATEGIGKAYANELARRGLDIVLVSRSKDKLYMKLYVNMFVPESQHGRQTQIIQTDFTKGHDIYPAIAEALRDLDIGILVNNVGMNYSDKLVHFLDIPNPEQQIFVTYFSRSLNSEYKSQGITVQCVAPFMVSTNMTHNLPPNLLLKSASAFAREALNTVGHSSYTSGCVSHALQNIALSIFFPDWLRLSSYCVKQRNLHRAWRRKFTFTFTFKSFSRRSYPERLTN